MFIIVLFLKPPSWSRLKTILLKHYCCRQGVLKCEVATSACKRMASHGVGGKICWAHAQSLESWKCHLQHVLWVRGKPWLIGHSILFLVSLMLIVCTIQDTAAGNTTTKQQRFHSQTACPLPNEPQNLSEIERLHCLAHWNEKLRICGFLVVVWLRLAWNNSACLNTTWPMGGSTCG